MIRIYFKTHNSFSKTCDFNRNIYRGLREAFKNPGGYSSVNHQHYHLYYLEERLYIETLVYIEFKIKIDCNKTKLNLYNNYVSLKKVEHIKGPCYALTDFPAKGFPFQLNRDPAQLAR